MAGVAVLAVAVLALAGCQGRGGPPPPAASRPAPNDETQLRDLYRRLTTALGAFDTDTVVALTCAKYQDRERSRFEDDPILRMDFFGPPEKSRSLGVDALTERLQPGLAPASPDAVRAVATAIASDDAAGYVEAMKRVRREGSSTTLDGIDKIVVNGDSAVIDATMTTHFFTQPPRVIDVSSQAVRVGGEWRDCTPPR